MDRRMCDVCRQVTRALGESAVGLRRPGQPQDAGHNHEVYFSEPVEICPVTDLEALARCQALLLEWKPESTPISGLRTRTQWNLIEAHGEEAGIVGCHHDFGNWRDFPAALGLTDDDRGSFVQCLYVKPHLRSRGIGEQVIEWFTATARAAGSRFVIGVPDRADAAGFEHRVRFLMKCGFEWVQPDEKWREPVLMARRP